MFKTGDKNNKNGKVKIIWDILLFFRYENCQIKHDMAMIMELIKKLT